MYKVIGSPKSRALRVMWALEELGQDYEVYPVAPRSDEILAHNPSGKIPALMTDEGVLQDSVAIVQYLADRHGGLTYPGGTVARARQDAMSQWIVSEIDAALWLKAKHSFVLPAEHRVEDVKKTAEWEFGQAMAMLERMKGDRPYLAGDMFTVPDLLVSHCAGWALSAKMPVPGGAFGDYLKSLRKRPAMQRVMEKIIALG